MQSDRILEVANIRDRSGKIRPKYRKRGASGEIPDGRYSAVREDGTLLLKITYREGVVHGPYCDYWSNGTLACEGEYKEGKQDGTWRFYNEDGSRMAIVHFKDGKETAMQMELPSDAVVERPPSPRDQKEKRTF